MDMNEGRKVRWYEVMYVVVLVALLAWSVFFMNPHKVGVVDMGRVFVEVGAKDKIEKELQKKDYFVKGDAMLKAFKLRMNGLEDKMKAAKTEADKNKVMGQMKAATEQFQQDIQPVKIAIQQYNEATIGTFRQRIQPYLNKVSQKRGIDVLMDKGGNILYYGNKVDLTEDVIKAAKEFFVKDMPVVEAPAKGSAPAKR